MKTAGGKRKSAMGLSQNCVDQNSHF